MKRQSQSQLMRSLGFVRAKFDPKREIMSQWHYYDHPSGVRLCLIPEASRTAAQIMTVAINNAVLRATRQLADEVAAPIRKMRSAAENGTLKLQ